MAIVDFERIQRGVQLVAPLAGSPSSPLETTELLRSLGPSLMPRSSLHQGAVSGLALLVARAASARVDALADTITPDTCSLPQRVVARALLASGGYGLRKLPDADDDAWPAGVARLSGELFEAAAIGGLIYELVTSVRERQASTREGAVRATVASSAALAFALYRSRVNLTQRRDFFTDEIDSLPLTLPRSLGYATAIATVGTGLGQAHRLSRIGLERYFGPGPTKWVLARAVNHALWAGGLSALYFAGIARIGRSNETIDPGYAHPPTSPLVSGSAASLCDFADLGQQGRRFVTDVVTPELIESTLDEPAAAHPIRVFVGFNQQPLYPAGRSETALEEMERVGAYDRGTILLVSPTGTGWVDHAMIEATEFFTRGDIATVCIQYGRYPSFLSLQKVRAGRQQFRQLVWGVRQRIRSMPVEERPRVLVFGESLGAWASSDVIMMQGVSGLDHYGIDRALWFGMPHLARWSATGLYRPGQLTPAGTVAVFDRWEQFARLDDEERARLRIVQLSHDNDPITLLTPTLLYRRPDWLGEERGRGVPPRQRWSPVITFLQTMVDAANAMRNEPGEFRSTGHDYRADTARFVAEGFALDYTEQQLAAVDAMLRTLELERAARISPVDGEHTPAPAQRTERHRRASRPEKLEGSRTGGADWLSAASEVTGITTPG